MLGQVVASILGEFNATSWDIRASALTSKDGLILALTGRMAQDYDENRVGALGAALSCLGHRAMKDFDKGHVEQIILKGEAGYIFIMPAHPELELIALVSSDAELDGIFTTMEQVAQKIRWALHGQFKRPWLMHGKIPLLSQGSCFDMGSSKPVYDSFVIPSAAK